MFAETLEWAPSESTTILIVALAVFLGDWINGWAKGAGLLLPGFLSAMLAGVVLTNLADWTRLRLDFEPIQKGGEVALNLFLVLSLMSVKLIAVAAILGPLAVNVLLQIAVIVAIAYFALFRLLGRNYEGGDGVRLPWLRHILDARRDGYHGRGLAPLRSGAEGVPADHAGGVVLRRPCECPRGEGIPGAADVQRGAAGRCRLTQRTPTISMASSTAGADRCRAGTNYR